ncbi:endo-1,4-beta-glucanase [Streptomyces sp. NPDC050564]|uniref:GH12 family glycosyl hydrolase domain-containing protein n=1 Tax=Streptomyces sp. NPDC050564 TaxID=3365631 RepID=UPI0037889194
MSIGCRSASTTKFLSAAWPSPTPRQPFDHAAATEGRTQTVPRKDPRCNTVDRACPRRRRRSSRAPWHSRPPPASLSPRRGRTARSAAPSTPSRWASTTSTTTSGGRTTARGTQCVWDTSRSGDTIGWGTSYTWAGKENAVKSYASTVLGWHWGWKVDRAATELPVRVGDRKPIRTSWQFSVSSSPGTMNVAYDLWLHAKNNADWQDRPTDEVMVWPNRQGGAGPLGAKYGSVSLGGAMWDIYQGDIGWKVYSFVRRTNTTGADLDLDDFTQALVRRKLLSNTQIPLRHRVGQRGLPRLRAARHEVVLG